MPKTLKESRPLKVREAEGAKSGRLQVGLITPGWGSSGYYSEKVLENAAAAKVFPAGTQMFLDHPGEAETYDRPERSVRDLAAVLTEDAVWDGTGLVAEAQVFGPFVDMLTDENLAQAIGVSIRAAAEVTTGEAEGRKGRIITELIEGVSADFVTKAGRGGSILAVLESARPTAVVERAVAHGVQEATANDIQQALSQALRQEYGGDKSWVWVRDFDDTTVWYEHETPDESGTYAQGYTLADNGAVTLSGDRTQVRARTEYVPVTPAGQSPPTQESKEDTMPQIEEARLRQLEEDASRVQTVEAERDSAQAERDAARQELSAHKAREAARPIATRKVGESESLPASKKARVVEAVLRDVPVKDGALDEDALTAAVEAAVKDAETEVAELAESLGAGRITGFGRTTTTDSDVIAEAEQAAASAFGRQVKEA